MLLKSDFFLELLKKKNLSKPKENFTPKLNVLANEFFFPGVIQCFDCKLDIYQYVIDIYLSPAVYLFHVLVCLIFFFFFILLNVQSQIELFSVPTFIFINLLFPSLISNG